MKRVIYFVFIMAMFSCLRGQNNTFTDVNAVLTGVRYSSVAWGDYDNDGDLDILLTGYTGSLYISKIYRNDVGIFTDIAAGLTGVGYSSVAWGDYDNDGDLDILLTGYTGSSYISKIYSNNAGIFIDIAAGLTGVYWSSVAWGDYDNDGDIDILLAGDTGYSSIAKIYRNNSNNTFSEVASGVTGVKSSSVAWGDYDNDGDLDILIAGDTGSTSIAKVYRNNGNSTFTDIAVGLPGAYNSSVAWGDYDNDGDLDILLTGWNGSTTIAKIYRNNGNSTFTDINASLQIMDRSSVSWGDYDNDGDLDLLMSGQNWNDNRYTKIYANNNGVFTPLITGLPQLTDGSLSWGDYDNDGDLDILLTGYNGSASIAKIYSNSGGTNRWLKVRTRGVYSNDDGNGARVLIYPNRQMREIASSEGIVSRLAHFGLGNQTTIDSIVVTWPNSGLRDKLTQQPSNQSIQIYEGNNIGNRVNVTPNGGVTIPAVAGQNHVYPITWAIVGTPPAGIHHVALYYSTDGGLTFPNLIADNETNDGIYSWVVPNLNSAQVRIGVKLMSTTGSLLAEGRSRFSFALDNVPPLGVITVTKPTNGGWTNSLPSYIWTTGSPYDYTILDIVVDGTILVTGVSGDSHSYQTPPSNSLSEGWHTFLFRYFDNAGNWSQSPSSSFRVDATTPSQFSLNAPTNNIWLATKTPTLVWNSSMDNGSGLAKYQVFVNNTIKKDNIAPTVTQWTVASGHFSDSAEAGLSNWNTTGTWGLTTSNPHSGSYCITDSPSGNYSNNSNNTISLAQAVELQGATSLSLSFWYKHYLESGDYVYLEASNNGSTWSTVTSYTGWQYSWTQATLNLNSYLSWTSIFLRYRISTNGNTTNDGFYIDDIFLTSNGVELTDGVHTWHVNAIDNVGNIQQSTDTRTLHIDTTAPHAVSGAFTNLSPVHNVWTADSLSTFTWTPCIDDGIGLDHYELWIDGSNVSGNIMETHYQLLSTQILQNGSHNWYVKAVDGLGNTLSSSLFTLKVDRNPPADFTLSSPANGSYFIMPTPTFTWVSTTDSGSGISHYELWIDGTLNINNLTQTSTSPANALSEGSHPWYVVAVDNVGNRKQSTAIWTTIGDWNPPTQPVLTSPINNQIVSMSHPNLVWQKSTDAGTGVHHYSIYIDNVLAIASYIPTDINAQVVSIQSPNPLVNGNHTWYIKAFDNAGGESSSSYGSFVVDVDITPPTSSIINPLANQYIGGTSYTITGSASDNTGGSGVQKVEISFDGGNTWFLTSHNGRSNSRSASYNPELSRGLQKGNDRNNLMAGDANARNRDSYRDVYNWQFVWTGYQTGSLTIKTRATDMNNNVETPPYSLPVYVEKIAPVIQTLSVTPNYAKAGTVTFAIAFQTGAHCNGMNNAVTPTVTITPAGGTARAVTQTSYQGNTWTGQTTIAQSDLNGTAVISVSNAKDNINNQMALNSTYTFVIDTAAPSAFNPITPATGTWMNVSQPQLTWGAATDVTSGIDHYALEIDGSTNSPGYNNIPATTTTIQPAAALTMGTHNWRIRAYDRAGNSTWSSTFSFGLDLTPPVSAIVAPTNNSTIGGLAYTISGTSSDGSGTSSSGIANVQIRINSGTWLNVVNTGTNYSTWTYSWAGYTSGTYTLQSRSTDNAENVETSPLTTTVTVNLNPPTVQTITITPNPAKVGVVNCTVVFTSNSGGLNLAVHPTVWFTTPNATVVNFTETSYSGNQWVGTASVLSTTQNGTATVHVTGAKDNYNNTMAPNQNAGTFVVDTVAPTVTSIVVNPQITNIRTDLAVQVNFTELTAGLNTNISPIVTIIPLGASSSGYIIVTQTGYNATTRVWTGVASITATTPEGLAAIKVASAADLAGNVMQIVTLQNQFTIDRSIPTAFNIIQPVTGSWTSNRQPLVSWSASSDAVSGLSCYKLEINGDQVGDNIAPTATSTTVQTMLPDGGYSIRVAAHDNAQAPNIRWSGTGPVLLNIDGTAPTSAITSPSTGFVVYGNSVTVSGNASDGIGANLGIGVKYVLLSKNGGAVWDTVYVATAQTQGTVTWNKTYTALTPGNYTIAVKAIDWLNNMELSTASILIYVQATAPLADFTANPVNGVAPLSVSFTDASTPGIWPIASREWNFGDNSPVSTLQNPSHVYASRGVYTVSLTVRDAYNTSNSRTYTNMITVTNQAPTVILPLPDLTRDEDFAPIVINLNNYFSDGDGDVLLYTVTVTPAQVSATITSNTLTILPVLNYYGSVSVAVTANDQYQPPALVRSPRTKTRALVTDTFVLQINPVNDAPVINLPATFTFAEDGDLVINLASYVSDVDNANLTVTAQNSAHVTVVLNGLSATLTALANWNGTESVSFTVSDGTLNTTDQTNVDVTPVNDAPTFDLPLAFTFAEDGSMLVNMALYAHDVDDDILSLTASGNTNVTVVITDMNVTLSAAPDWNGTEQVTFTINDNMGRSIVSAVTDIIVTPVNDPPSIDGYSPLQSNVSVALNETLSFSITASDIDSPVNYSWFVNDVNQDNATNAFTYQFTQFATYFVKVIVSDSLTTVEQMWTVSVPVSTDNEIMTPLVTGLQSNYPNPFNPQTTIRYSVKTSGLVDLSVYDIKGQLIKDLKYGVEQPGTYNLIWDGRNNANRAVSSGMYYIRMKTDQGIDVLKITLTK